MIETQHRRRRQRDHHALETSRAAGPIALDMGVHYTDIFRYFLGDLESAYGTAFIAEPIRRLARRPGRLAASTRRPRADAAPPATTPCVALFRASSGVLVQLAYVPRGPGASWSSAACMAEPGR